MIVTNEQFKKINTYDKVATDLFGVEEFGFRFNYNFRWFWSKSYKCLPIKTFGRLPLEESKKIQLIYLN